MPNPEPSNIVDDDVIIAAWQTQTGFSRLVIELLEGGMLPDRRVARLARAHGAIGDLLRADLIDTAARHRALAGDDPGGVTLQAELFGIPLVGTRHAIKTLGDDAAAIGGLIDTLRTSGAAYADDPIAIFPESMAAATCLDAMPAALHRLKRGALAAIEDGDFHGEGGALFFESAARLTPSSEIELDEADARAESHGHELAVRVLVGARLHANDRRSSDIDDLDAAHLHEQLAALRDGDSPPPLDDPSQNALANDEINATLERKQRARTDRWRAALAALSVPHNELVVHPPLPWRALIPCLAGLEARLGLAIDRRRALEPASPLAPEGFVLHHFDGGIDGETLVLRCANGRRGPVRIPRHHFGARRRGVLRALARGGELRRTDDIEAAL